MKHTFISALIAIALAIICYFVLTLFQVNDTIVQIAAAGPLAFVTSINQLLKERSRRLQFSTEPKEIVPLTEYALPWHQLFVYGTLIFLAIEFFLGALSGIFTVALISLFDTTPNPNLTAFSASFVVGLVMCIVLYFIGRWVGVRSSLPTIRSLLIVIAIIITVRFASVGYYYMAPSEYMEVFETIGVTFWESLINSVLLFAFFGAMGYWRGRARRIPSYINFLLKKLPKDTQSTFVELIYEETQKSTSS